MSGDIKTGKIKGQLISHSLLFSLDLSKLLFNYLFFFFLLLLLEHLCVHVCFSAVLQTHLSVCGCVCPGLKGFPGNKVFEVFFTLFSFLFFRSSNVVHLLLQQQKKKPNNSTKWINILNAMITRQAGLHNLSSWSFSPQQSFRFFLLIYFVTFFLILKLWRLYPDTFLLF